MEIWLRINLCDGRLAVSHVGRLLYVAGGGTEQPPQQPPPPPQQQQQQQEEAAASHPILDRKVREAVGLSFMGRSVILLIHCFDT